jgi:hypothetical protein
VFDDAHNFSPWFDVASDIFINMSSIDALPEKTTLETSRIRVPDKIRKRQLRNRGKNMITGNIGKRVNTTEMAG